MDDGGKGPYNQTILHTRAFTKPEIDLLVKALEDNFGLRTRLMEKVSALPCLKGGESYSYSN
jgi:hypothetical protein